MVASVKKIPNLTPLIETTRKARDNAMTAADHARALDLPQLARDLDALAAQYSRVLSTAIRAQLRQEVP